MAGWVAGAIAVAGLGSAYLGSQASKSAGNAQAASADAATQLSREQYNQTRTDLAPYRYVGGQSLNTLAAASGLTPDPSVGGTVGRFQTDPGYQFALTQGQKGVERSAAARGGAFSGPALQALSRYNVGMASQQYSDWWNRMAGLAGVGQTSTTQTGTLGANYAANAGNSLMAAGNARASGIMGSANSIAGGLNSGINNYLMYNSMQNQPYPYTPGGGPVMYSDRRLKENIERIDTLPSGLPLYKFRYKADPTMTYVGVMADEVAEVFPEAVLMDRDGYLLVLYDRIH